MKFSPGVLVILLISLYVTGCNTVSSPAQTGGLVTPEATAETRALYRNMKELSASNLMFGHQNTSAYGVKWIGEKDRSDVKDVVGSYPAIMGWDIGHLERGDDQNLDGISFAFISSEIKRTFKRGGISTISWHMRDLVTGGTSWDKNPTVAKLIPGGEHHDKLIAALDAFADFNETLKVTGDNGEDIYVPIIFRPWHEHNGDWFWWGKGENLASEQDYIALWRFTVDYLRDVKGLRNLIYAFSPDRSRMDLNQLPDSYLYAYPGDNYVDLIGLDNYWDLGHPANNASLEERSQAFVRSLEAITDIAASKHKLAALTEGGQETVHQPRFWTDMILANITANGKTSRISYLLVWRNANKARENIDHFYAPYKGHASEDDFKVFYDSPVTLFESDLPDLYH